MKEKQQGKYGVGWILLDCLLFVELFIDIYSGKITVIQIIKFVVFSATVAFFLTALFRKKRKRKPSNTANPGKEQMDEDEN